MSNAAKGTTIGAGIGGPVGAVAGAAVGRAIGSLFGDSKKKDPYAFYKKYPEITKEALARGIDPKFYKKYQQVYKMMDEFQVETDAARTATEQRYKQGISEFADIERSYRGQTYQPPPDDRFEYGVAERADIESARKAGTAESMQGLVSSGLAGSTAAPAVAARYRDIATRQNVALSQAISQYRQGRRDIAYQNKQAWEQQRLANINATRQGRIGFIASRTDLPPDPAMFQNMMQFYTKYAKGAAPPSMAKSQKILSKIAV